MMIAILPIKCAYVKPGLVSPHVVSQRAPVWQCVLSSSIAHFSGTNMTYPKEAMFPSLQRIWGNAEFWPALVAVGRGMPWIEPLVQEVWCEHTSLSP